MKTVVISLFLAIASMQLVFAQSPKAKAAEAGIQAWLRKLRFFKKVSSN
jgi:hypothetical protein